MADTECNSINIMDLRQQIIQKYAEFHTDEQTKSFMLHCNELLAKSKAQVQSHIVCWAWLEEGKLFYQDLTPVVTLLKPFQQNLYYNVQIWHHNLGSKRLNSSRPEKNWLHVDLLTGNQIKVSWLETAKKTPYHPNTTTNSPDPTPAAQPPPPSFNYPQYESISDVDQNDDFDLKMPDASPPHAQTITAQNPAISALLTTPTQKSEALEEKHLSCSSSSSNEEEEEEEDNLIQLENCLNIISPPRNENGQPVLPDINKINKAQAFIQKELEKIKQNRQFDIPGDNWRDFIQRNVVRTIKIKDFEKPLIEEARKNVHFHMVMSNALQRQAQSWYNAMITHYKWATNNEECTLSCALCPLHCFQRTGDQYKAFLKRANTQCKTEQKAIKKGKRTVSGGPCNQKRKSCGLPVGRTPKKAKLVPCISQTNQQLANLSESSGDESEAGEASAPPTATATLNMGTGGRM